jgi:TolB-like protein
LNDSGHNHLTGRTLAHYQISAAIGAGGMGEVYRATDTKLARDIALKVLPPDMASDPDRLARFQREARAVAALNHPNVVTVYSVEESDNVHFITMELIEGQPLDRLICANGLPADRILEIAGAIADALAAAHEKGIVHRDLKPGNVMVTNDGRIKVLDFGLAKDVGAESSNDATLTSTGRTRAGVVMGTPAYMSPEQVSGRPLDHRTDIFSLGVLLHEMFTGCRPFEGSSAELISSILRDTPASVNQLRPDLPADLARVIRRCLEKDPRYRMQTARDVSNEFRDLAKTLSRKEPFPSSAPRPVASSDSGAARAGEGFWVAVLPFRYKGTNAELDSLAEGITEEIITGLSRFSYLRVIARSSTQKYSSESGDVRAIGQGLGARYVMEGTVRLAGSRLRVGVQLVDAVSGAHLWAETYERTFSPDTLFELQDDIVPRVVSTVADIQGVLPRNMTEALRNLDPEKLTPYEALLRSFGHHQRLTATEHSAARAVLERAVQQPPDRGDCWAMLSWLYREEYTHGFNPRPDPLGRALTAARRAVDASPTNHLAYAALAAALFFQRELGAFRAAAERSLALNSMDSLTSAYLGFQIAYSGDWQRGCALAQRAIQLNPNSPGWYWSPLILNAYRLGAYQRALDLTLKVNMPAFWRTQFMLAICNGQLGHLAAAQNAVQELLRIRPDFLVVWREELCKWWEPDLVEHLIEGLRKAGLQVPGAAATPELSSAVPTSRTASGEARANEGFWVAVLPFKYTGSNHDLKALAEGLTEEVITGLSRFSYLRVIARGSTAKYSSESGDVRAIGKELGARYVMEGSLRQAGSKLRFAVQLADTVSGAHLWADTYERAFTPESVFELQDDLVPRIVSTVADQYGVLPRSMSEALRNKSEDALTPHEAVLRAFSYFTRLTLEEHAAIRRILESAVQKAPDQADCWAMLSLMYIVEYSDGFNALPNPLDRALAAAQRAVERGPTQALGYYALAFVYFFRKEKAPFRAAVERTQALNPMDGTLIGLLGLLMHHAGEEERGLKMVDVAMQLNPNYPGLLRFTAFTDAYCHGRYAEALEAAVRINMPGFFYAHAARAAALGQLGHREAARKAVQDLLALRPDFAATARHEYAKWFEPEQVEHLVDGLRKAGLEI